MVRVLPVPAPARMQTGPDTACAAVRCSSSRPASTASAPDTACVLSPTCDILSAPSVMRTALDPPSLRGQSREASPGMSALLPWTRSGPGLDPRPLSREDHVPMTAAPSTVTMYTTSWCGYCVRLKKLMQREGIEYAEVNIEIDESAADIVMQANGGNRTVPTLVFPDGAALTNPSIDQVKSQLAQS